VCCAYLYIDALQSRVCNILDMYSTCVSSCDARMTLPGVASKPLCVVVFQSSYVCGTHRALPTHTKQKGQNFPHMWKVCGHRYCHCLHINCSCSNRNTRRSLSLSLFVLLCGVNWLLHILSDRYKQHSSCVTISIMFIL